MKLTGFKAMNYRCVNDSGWIDVERLTVLVGRNQSGKSALLRALHKFNPYQSEPYNMDREWPRGRRKGRVTNAPAVVVRFEFSDEESNALSAVAECPLPKQVEISRSYDGHRTFVFHEDFDPDRDMGAQLMQKLKELARLVSDCEDTFKTTVESYFKELEGLVIQRDFPALAKALQSAESKLTPKVATEEPEATKERTALQQIVQNVAIVAESCQAKSKRSLVEEEITKHLPVFVYMDDYRRYYGSTFLNQLKERKDSKKLTPEDETILILMKMAGLDIEDQVAKTTKEDREQRTLDLNDASITLTNEMAGRWSQEEYVVQFQADHNHFMTFVKRPGQNALVPLEEESRGFQWFFSFDLHFAYETQGTLKGAVILLDEPGLHLHPKAQMDLLKRLEAYCEGNQLIYTTHLPFMIDLTKPERIRVVDRGTRGTVVSDDILGGGEDARFSLLAKLGMSASQSLLVAKYNLVVEGPEDYWNIVGMSELLKRSGEKGLDDRLQMTATGGASEAAYMATFMCGQDLNVAVLFDSDKAGESAEEALVKKWLAKYREKHINILKVGEVFAPSRPEATLEDLFTEEYYVSFVEKTYQKELAGQKLDISSRREPRIIMRVEAALRAVGIDRFNKGSVAKLIRNDLRTKNIKDLPKEAAENFERLFAQLKKIVDQWDREATSHER